MSWFRRTARAISAYSIHLALCLFAGATLILAALPFAGYKIPEATATLAGSFLGAVITVLAATWYARRERLGGDREAALAIRLLVEDIPGAVDEIFELARVQGEANITSGFGGRTDPIRGGHRNGIDPDQEKALHDRIDQVTTAIAEAQADLKELKVHLGSFGAVNIVGILDLQRSLSAVATGIGFVWGWHKGTLVFPANNSPIAQLEVDNHMLKQHVESLKYI